jgi:Pyridoxamine 5'-phosphate oxidase
MKPQRRRLAMAMAADEIDDLLRRSRTCRVATAGPEGPHVSPLWFVWDGEALWLSTLTRSRRWTHLRRDPRVAVVVDDGTDFGELRGVELYGRVEVVGEVPRVGDPCAELAVPERAFAEKYLGGRFGHDGRHAWLRLCPAKIVSWDHRKLGAS